MELARNLKVESVSRLGATGALRVAPDQSIRDAVALMREHRVGCVLICRDDRVLGLFTERDLLRRVLAEQRSLDEPIISAMTTDPVTVKEKEVIGSAVTRMKEGGYRHLPVVDDEGHPCGILSVKRIVHYLVEHFAQTVCNQPPAPNNYPKKPEGA